MKSILKAALSLILALATVAGIFSMSACQKDEPEAAALLENCGIIHEPEFGGVYIKNTIDEFNALGAKYGDSVTVEFSNGYRLENIPYYNGYYTLTGEPLLVAYPGYDYIKACINNGDDLWEVAKLEDDMTATVSLFERGAFYSIQNARDITYNDDRALYGSDEIFANFRAVESAAVKPGTIYRSASPCDNRHNRATYVDALIQNAGVAFILNLSDNDENIASYISADDFNCPYFESLYEAGNVKPIALNMNYGSDEFKEKIADGLAAMIQHEGPYLIHCTEGKDRTGFVCMLLEALAGASYEEIEHDYMITYANYYSITKETDSERYDVIVENVLVPMIKSMSGDDSIDVRTVNLSVYAQAFLENAGLDSETIDRLKAKIQAQ